MTDSENSQPQNDSDEDIYKDIPEFNFEEELAKLEGSKEIYKQEASDLTEKVKVLAQENRELKKLNEVLKKNLSILLKTAQAEVQRKDSVIDELRSKVDSFTFKRNKKSTSDKFTSTDDLIPDLSYKQDFLKQKSSCEKKRSKSYENWTSSDSEWRFNQDNEKKTLLKPGKEEISNCGEKKSDYQRGNAQNTNFRYSETNRDTRNERRKERKSSRYEDSSDHRRPFRENHRDHLLYDSYDKKRHSRSSDNRFLSRRRSSRERKHDRRRNKSCERKKGNHRKGDSSERSRRRGSKKQKSPSRESKESSLEKPKTRFSRDNEFIARIKEGVEVQPEVSKDDDGVENKRRTESSEKKRNIEESVFGNGKHKQNKEKIVGKSDKRKNLEIFSTKSPLDALYNNMVASRNLSQCSNSKEDRGTAHFESNPEGEFFGSLNEFQNRSPAKEDWTLSFKNERQNEKKPITLFSRRMMQKFSLESKEKQLKKNSEGKEAKEKTEQPTECRITEQLVQTEKEPGELTDDESVIESSKEFQELTKVAALESEIIKSPATEYPKESLVVINPTRIEPSPKDSQMELGIFIGDKEESATCKDIESKREISDVVEYSPFKNNYKLIEISPIKPAGNEHILDFYSKKVLKERSRGSDPSEEKTGLEKGKAGKLPDTSGEEDSWRNSSSENNLENELEIVTPSMGESMKEKETFARKEKEPQKNEEKELTEKREKKSMVSKEKSSFTKGKRRSSLKKGTEKSAADERTQKRKRKLDNEVEGKSDSKKLKLEKSELPRKSVRSKRNSKSGSEGQQVQEVDIRPWQEVENRMDEDYSSREFLKPKAGPEVSETPNDFGINKCPATDYKIAATMSVTGVVRLETPNKCMGQLKNLMINEQMIFNILDSKNNSQFSPLIGPKSIEMTPRRMLKNDLMLTDSEDDSLSKRNAPGEDIDGVEKQVEEEEEEGEEEENESGLSESGCSDCGSDSGASNFVDLL